MSAYSRGHFHPFLFTVMTLCAAAELGLSAFLISVGNANGTWPSARYHALLIMFAFNSSWTLFFSTAYCLYLFDGAVHFLANVASSVIWIFLTSVLWASAVVAPMKNNDCSMILSSCRQTFTVEALGWTEFGLCVTNMLTTCAWIYSTRKPQVGDSRRMV
ncbi:hypothetical protein BDP27DRAFT_1210793 [Rhodocollybia butyracea]|uniref:MARVEL domain-containing protein n=1 Tax=Rhodocollybia butyracea TaxID=206335 RepID=A0A9P5UFH5_9AGAR|nr:hypothetical protein BDP27DRAFT_1210793 [Rhodocollybia butyracea]